MKNMKKQSVIGIHFGHDASFAVLTDKSVYYQAFERTSRCKHAISFSTTVLEEALSKWRDSPVHITSTQGVPILYDTEAFRIDVEGSQTKRASEWFDLFTSDNPFPQYLQWNPDFENWNATLVEEQKFGWLHPNIDGAWKTYDTMAMIGRVFDRGAAYMQKRALIHAKRIKYETHAVFLNHHYAHAMYAVAAAGEFKNSLVVTADGGNSDDYGGGGIYFFSRKDGLIPITPIGGWVGFFYDLVSRQLGLGAAGGAGKLMGLAPYGKPIYYEDKFFGTRFTITQGNLVSIASVTLNWLYRIQQQTKKSFEWDKGEVIPPKYIADVAASAQLVVEKNMLALLEAADSIAHRCGFKYEVITMAGGVALNCPSNSNIFDRFEKFTLPPAVNDEGLAVGCAVLSWKNTTGDWPDLDLTSPFLGYQINEDAAGEIAKKMDWVEVPGEPIVAAAQLILAGEPIGIIYGRSEIGPRALGHRSIVATPTTYQSWKRVNELKRREMWRPLAPAVLATEALNYFVHGPASSRYMLFNYKVTSKDLPAVTHFDHTARVQHVTDATEPLFKLISALMDKGHPPVVLNTSFNGPKVPIVETEMDAFLEAEKIGLQFILTSTRLYRSPPHRIVNRGSN